MAQNSRMGAFAGQSKISSESFVDDSARIERGEPVAYAMRERHFLRDDEHRHAVVG